MDSKKTASAIVAHSLGVRTDDPHFFTERRVPVLSDTERRAYQAAWRIKFEPIPEQLDWSKFACKSTRESREIERVARIIAEEMGR